MTDPSLNLISTLAAGLILVSWWKPVLVVATVAAWAWVIATVYDKDAARWYFKRQAWNVAHMFAAIGAIAVVLVAPLSFFITFPIMIVILVADLGIYAFLRNRDSRVPAKHRWSMDFKKMAEKRAAKKSSKTAKGVMMAFESPTGVVPSPEPETPQYAVRVAAESLLNATIELRGSQLDITPIRKDAYGATCLVDGLRTPIEQIPAQQAVAIIDFFKVAAGLDTEDRRRKLSGTMKFGVGSTANTDARVTTKGTSSGLTLSVLISPEAQVQRRIDELGMLPNQLEELRKIVEDGTGVVLLAAPPDNGRTSTMYAMVRAHDAYTSNVQTIEIEPQAPIEGIRLNHFDPQEDGAEFSTLVRSILRRDPDVVAVAELPDDETAKTIARADHEHTRTYVSMRADSALAAIQMFCRAVGDQELAAKALRGVVAHRMLRRLSENAKIPFQPTPEMLKKLGLPAEVKTLYRTEGKVLIKDKLEPDPVSGGTGYFGQVGAFAVHYLDDEARKLIAANDMTGLRALFRQRKQPSINTAAMQLVVKGDTSVEEVLRVLHNQSKGSSSGSSERQSAAPASA
ncbi:MAG: ATPase, T2SS/T4P/T4SS family [Phycisphaerales bacterium JB050]